MKKSIFKRGVAVCLLALMILQLVLTAPAFAQDLTEGDWIYRELGDGTVEIAGYTDSMHDKNAAYALSLDMAQRVGVYLSQHDISTSRMFIVGRGATRPIAAQDDMGRLTNRRIEIRLSPAR